MKTLIFILLFTSLLFSQTYTYGVNLVNNGTFETFTGTADDATSDDWTYWAETGDANDQLLAVTDKHGGIYACKITRTDGASFMTSVNIAVEASTMYRVSWWNKADGSTASRYRIADVTNGTTYNASTDTWGAPVVYNNMSNTTASYVFESVNITTQSNTANITIAFTPRAGAGFSILDDVQIQKMTLVTDTGQDKGFKEHSKFKRFKSLK